MKSGYNKGRGNLYKIIFNDPQGINQPREYIYNPDLKPKTKQTQKNRDDPFSQHFPEVFNPQVGINPMGTFYQEFPTIDRNPLLQFFNVPYLELPIKSIYETPFPNINPILTQYPTINAIPAINISYPIRFPTIAPEPIPVNPNPQNS